MNSSSLPFDNVKFSATSLSLLQCSRELLSWDLDKSNEETDVNAYALFTVPVLDSFIPCFPDALLIEALTRKPRCSANNSGLARNVCMTFKLVLTVFLAADVSGRDLLKPDPEDKAS